MLKSPRHNFVLQTIKTSSENFNLKGRLLQTPQNLLTKVTQHKHAPENLLGKVSQAGILIFFQKSQRQSHSFIHGSKAFSETFNRQRFLLALPHFHIRVITIHT